MKTYVKCVFTGLVPGGGVPSAGMGIGDDEPAQ
jgi:hypothetical protein